MAPYEPLWGKFTLSQPKPTSLHRYFLNLYLANLCQIPKIQEVCMCSLNKDSLKQAGVLCFFYMNVFLLFFSPSLDHYQYRLWASSPSFSSRHLWRGKITTGKNCHLTLCFKYFLHNFTYLYNHTIVLKKKFSS